MRKVLFNKLSAVDGTTESSFDADDVTDLSKYFPRLDGCRWNYVVSAKPHKAATSDEVTSQADRLVLTTIRSNSDLIITTGKTAVAEQLNGSSYAPMMVLTNNSKIDFPALQTPSKHQILLTIETGRFQNSKVSCLGSTSGELTNWLRNHTGDYPSKVFEGGIDTGTDLVNAGFIDQICLSVTSSENFTESLDAAHEFLSRTSRNFKATQVLECENTWFFTFQVNG